MRGGSCTDSCYSVSRAVSVVNVVSASPAFISPDPLSRPVGGNPWALGILLWGCEGFSHTGWVFRTKPRDTCSLFYGCLHPPTRPLSRRVKRSASVYPLQLYKWHTIRAIWSIYLSGRITYCVLLLCVWISKTSSQDWHTVLNVCVA